MNNRFTKYLIWFILLLGIGLRYGEYAANRSLWADEALTAARIQTITLKDAFFLKGKAFHEMQSYPIGFLAAVKLSVRVLGYDEFGLRFYPFVCSLLALFLFARLSGRILSPPYHILAILYFAISRDIVYYSSELKPFMSDILVVLGLYILFERILRQKWSTKDFVFYILGGVGAIFFSLPAVFILAGVGGFIFLESLVKKDFKLAGRMVVLACIWMGALGFYYMMNLQYIKQDEVLSGFWAASFIPVNENLGVCFQWFVVAFKRVFSKFMQFPAGVAGLFFLIGVLRLRTISKQSFALFLPPLALVLCASALRVYPFDGRVILFLFPSIIWLIFLGVSIIGNALQPQLRRTFGLAVCLFLFFYPSLLSARQFLEFKGAEDIKPALHYIQKHYQPGDLIAVHSGSHYPYQFYARQFGLIEDPIYFHRKWIAQFIKNVHEKNNDDTSNGRMWVLFSHYRFNSKLNEKEIVNKILASNFQLVDKYNVEILPHSTPALIDNQHSASVYLYYY